MHELLKKHEILFDGTLGQWKGTPYKVELKEGENPYHAHPYEVPHKYKRHFGMKVDQLCKVRVLKNINRSEWAAPTFIVPKNDSTFRFILDFRELNKQKKTVPCTNNSGPTTEPRGLPVLNLLRLQYGILSHRFWFPI